MKFADFCAVSERFWDVGFSHGFSREVLEQSGLVLGQAFLYPTMLRCCEAGDYFIAELAGASRIWQGLRTIQERAAGPAEYFYPFSDARRCPVVTYRVSHTMLSGFALSTTTDYPSFERRFPFLSGWPRPKFIVEGSGALLEFHPGANYCVLENCLILNRIETAFRIKHIVFALVVDRSTLVTDYRIELSKPVVQKRWLRPRRVSSLRAERHAVAEQFASLFLSDARETSLGKFLLQHPQIVERGFGATQFVAEPRCEWQEGTPRGEDNAIRPDLLVVKTDGNTIVCDLKRSLRDRGSVTKGERRRRRFIDAVEEGIAQLAHYDEYFRYEANRRFVEDRYGLSVENPQLRLIVGNAENFRHGEVAEASRRLRGFELMDWDTFMQLYLDPQPTASNP